MSKWCPWKALALYLRAQISRIFSCLLLLQRSRATEERWKQSPHGHAILKADGDKQRGEWNRTAPGRVPFVVVLAYQGPCVWWGRCEFLGTLSWQLCPVTQSCARDPVGASSCPVRPGKWHCHTTNTVCPEDPSPEIKFGQRPCSPIHTEEPGIEQQDTAPASLLRSRFVSSWTPSPRNAPCPRGRRLRENPFLVVLSIPKRELWCSFMALLSDCWINTLSQKNEPSFTVGENVNRAHATENRMEVLQKKKLNRRVAVRSSNSTSGCISRKGENSNLNRHTDPTDHTSTIYNSRNMAAT